MMHTQWRLIGVMLGVTCVLGACGGGGGSTAPTPPPCNADTRTCFVRGNGNDTNSGASAASALRQITKAGQLARDGYTIVVGPGSYDGNVTLATLGESANGVRFIGDPTGVQTGDAPGPVLVKPTGANPGFTLSSSPGSIIDGF